MSGPRIYRASLFGLVALLGGCNGTPADPQSNTGTGGDGGSDSGDDGGSGGASDSDDAEPTEVVNGEMVIAVQPVEVVGVSAVFEQDPSQPAPALVGDQYITFAWGDEYPSSLEVSIGDTWGTCGLLTGTFAIDEVRTLDPSLTIEPTAGGAFRVAVTEQGDYDGVVSGVWTATEPSACAPGFEPPFELPIRLNVTASVRRPVGVQVVLPEGCDDANVARMQSGAHFPFNDYYSALRLALIDESGESFIPDNTTAERPATITVSGDPKTQLGLMDADLGLSSLTASGGPDRLIVSALGEEVSRLELVETAAIERAQVRFQLQGAGGGGSALESGQVYGAGGWARTSSSIAVLSLGLFVEGDPLCTAPSRDSLRLTSTTPSTCQAFDQPGHGDSFPGSEELVLDVSGDVIASGICGLRLEAPGFAGGAGWSQELVVEILNAESLISWMSEGRG